jgi:sulfur carrier protein ThiS
MVDRRSSLEMRDMQVQVNAVGFLKRYTSRQVASVQVEVNPGTTVHELFELLGIPEEEVLRVAVNDQIVMSDHVLTPYDTVRVIPPIGGG